MSGNDSWMHAALVGACSRGDVVTVRTCLERGGNVNMKYIGQAPLRVAMLNNHPQVVSVLLACMDLDIADVGGHGWTALHYACGYNSAACISVLGADSRVTRQLLNRKDRLGRTALLMAVEEGNLDCVKEMAKLEGVDWETKNKDGKSLSDVAQTRKKWEVLQYLKQKKNKTPTKIALEKTKGKRMREIMDKIKTLKEMLKVEDKSLIKKQAEEKTAFIIRLENEKKSFEEKQTQEKIELHKDYESKITELEEQLQTFTIASAPPTPECPVCLDPMPPPIRIFNCPNGHLVCTDCKEKMEVAICPLCYEPIKGRATAMEQMLRNLYNLN